MALRYRHLLQVEQGWRELKQQLDLRPMFRRKEDRIRVYALLSFLGLPLIRVAENRTQRDRPRIRRKLQRLVLADLSGPAGQVSRTSKSAPHIGRRSCAASRRGPSPGLPTAIANSCRSQAAGWLGILGRRLSRGIKISSPCRSTRGLQR